MIKTMAVAKLKELLAELDDELLLCVNQVGNVAIMSHDGQDFIGYICFLEDKIERYDRIETP